MRDRDERAGADTGLVEAETPDMLNLYLSSVIYITACICLVIMIYYVRKNIKVRQIL